MYKDIFKVLSINIESLDYYTPSIDYNKCDIKNIDYFLSKNINKKNINM